MTKQTHLGNQYAVVNEWVSETASAISDQVETTTRTGKPIFIFTDEHKFEEFPRPLEQELHSKNILSSDNGTNGIRILNHVDTLDDFLYVTDSIEALLEKGEYVKLFIDIRDYKNLKRIVKLTSLMARVYDNFSVTYTIHTKRNYVSVDKTNEDIVRELPIRIAPENLILL